MKSSSVKVILKSNSFFYQCLPHSEFTYQEEKVETFFCVQQKTVCVHCVHLLSFFALEETDFVQWCRIRNVSFPSFPHSFPHTTETEDQQQLYTGQSIPIPLSGQFSHLRSGNGSQTYLNLYICIKLATLSNYM